MLHGKWLDAVAAVSIAIAAIVCLAVVSPTAREAFRMETSGRRGYFVGQHIDITIDRYTKAKAVVIIFARSDCPVCTRVRPALARVLANLGASDADTGRLLVTPSRVSLDDASYADGLGIPRPQVMAVSPASVRVRTVPTVLVVDQRGIIRFAKEGDLGPGDEAGILAAVRSTR